MTFDAWPVNSRTITQGYGENPEFYAKFGLPGHEGLDFRAPEGSRIYAVWDGIVKRISTDLSHPYGNFVVIQHANDYTTTYAHLSRIDVKENQTVYSDESIGLAGNTGNSFGAHLHLTLKRNGKYIISFPILDTTQQILHLTLKRNGKYIDPTPFLPEIE